MKKMKESKYLIEMLQADKVKVNAKIENYREKIALEKDRINNIDTLIKKLENKMAEETKQEEGIGE